MLAPSKRRGDHAGSAEVRTDRLDNKLWSDRVGRGDDGRGGARAMERTSRGFHGVTAMTHAILILIAAPFALAACAPVAGAAVGAAAVDYFVDNNNVCDGPNDAGLIDSDC